MIDKVGNGEKLDIKFTQISTVGEFGLIDRFSSAASRFSSPLIVQGIGDDAATIKPSQGRLTVVTTDILIQGIHFDLSYTSMGHLGRKSAAANLSDIAAMSAVPTVAFVSLGIHSNLSVEMIEDFYSSLADELGKYHCVIAGGDTSASPIGFVVSITLMGEVEPDRRTTRNGAGQGDIVCVTGDLGRSHAGLRILQREKNRYIEAGQPADFSPDFDGYDDALQKHLLPGARVTLAREITDKIRVHSMIDISDGLVSDMLHICKASGVSVELEEELIPIDPMTRRIAESFGESPVDYALYGGEDYELAFTIAEDDFKKLYSLEGNVRAIGRVKPGDPKVMIRRADGKTNTFADFPSYQHFAKRDKS
ncbi:MAG: thiamine-phosphate kinase [Bacteroidetes bacterium]|nr:thiamine-phosphate kinase [Bacteroidota bacterium]